MLSIREFLYAYVYVYIGQQCNTKQIEEILNKAEELSVQKFEVTLLCRFICMLS